VCICLATGSSVWRLQFPESVWRFVFTFPPIRGISRHSPGCWGI
jgi:hypothetical protein